MEVSRLDRAEVIWKGVPQVPLRSFPQDLLPGHLLSALVQEIVRRQFASSE